MTTDKNEPGRLPWTTPRLECLGTMDDVRNDAGGELDDDGFGADGVTGS